MSDPSGDLHPRLLALMSRMEADRTAGDFDFIRYKDEIVVLHGELPEEKHKVQCIVFYGMLITFGCDIIAENGGDPQELRNVAAAEHKLFLIKEASGADGDIDPDALARLTRREVDAGRLEEDDGLARLAEAGSQVFASREPETPKPGLWKRLFG